MPRTGTDPLQQAARTLELLGLDQEQPIDVLAAIEGLGLTLAFVRLDGLLGAVVPHGDGGVLVTTQRGSGVQRYTAAHEVGHWVMHQDRVSLDGYEDVLGRATNDRESQAQLFAAYFLMPPPLLWSCLRRLGLRRGDVGPGDAYRLSRELNVSYEAAVRRLASHGWLDWPATRALLGVQRLQAMAEASGGRRPESGSAELWEAGMATTGRTLTVTVGDEVLVDLPENRTTPYRWLAAAAVAARPAAVPARPRPRRPDGPGAELPPGPSVGTSAVAPSQAAARASLALLPTARPDGRPARLGDPGPGLLGVSDEFVAPGRPGGPAAGRGGRLALAAGEDRGGDEVGGQGLRRLQLRCAEEGRTTVGLAYAHAFDPEQAPAATWRVDLDVRPSLPTRQRRAHVASAGLDEVLPGDPDDELQFG